MRVICVACSITCLLAKTEQCQSHVLYTLSPVAASVMQQSAASKPLLACSGELLRLLQHRQRAASHTKQLFQTLHASCPNRA